MGALVYAMLSCVLVVEYLRTTWSLPRSLALLPDALAAIAAIIVIVAGTRSRFRNLDGKYVIVFALLLVHLAAGAIANHLSPGVLVNGLRIYAKSLPFFFLPLVVPVDERSLRRQLLLIAMISLVQFPIAWQQRQSTADMGLITGDMTVGTLGISSILSMFLCSAAAVALAMHLRGYLSRRKLLLFLIATLPATMINETKGTLLLMPVALGVPVVLLAQGGAVLRMRRALLAVALIATFIAVFVPVYDHYMRPRWGYGLLEFFQMEGRLEGYLNKESELGSQKSGKLDAVVLPIKAARGDPSQLGLGVGIGNMSESRLEEGFAGEYYKRFGHLVGPSASLLLWEIGWVGLALAMCLFPMIFRDALVARRSAGLHGALALGWTAVVCIMFIGMFYKLTIKFESLTFLFWYFSGIVVATSVHMRRAPAVAAAGRDVATVSRQQLIA